MSLNWKEINLILEELDLPGTQIQKVHQHTYDLLSLRLYKGGAKTLLISLSPGACRLHESFSPLPKSDRPLRFGEFLNSRILNGRITEALQLGQDQIVRLMVKGQETYYIYLRLWSNAANIIVTDPGGTVLDAMKRIPAKNEISGGSYQPEEQPGQNPAREFRIRSFPPPPGSLETPASFNQMIDHYYRQEKDSLSLETLKEQGRRKFEGTISRISASLERLREKQSDFSHSERLREYGDLILSNPGRKGEEWLEVENFFAREPASQGSSMVRIKVNPRLSPAAQAEEYYEQYRKAKSGSLELARQIEEEEKELLRQEDMLKKLLEETEPLALRKILKAVTSPKGGAARQSTGRAKDASRPGLSFQRKDWLIIVGRDAAENDTLLRKHVNGNDYWLHAREYAGSYVFIKYRSGKSVPLDILLDAGNLALFYSKGRNKGEGDLFYTQVKYLRRAKNGPRGLVIPTQEKNIFVRLEAVRLKDLEESRLSRV